MVAFTTGFATFMLEVAWFRSLRAAYQATTESWALVLASALIGLAAGAQLSPWLRKRSWLRRGGWFGSRVMRR